MYYELFDTTGGRLLASHPDVTEIWREVRGYLATGDPSYLTDLVIVRTDDRAEKHLVVEGGELAAQALANTVITPVAA